MTARIEDYALIGDCLTAALVSRAGSIDWLCWPRFDSDACFAALLGDENNGHWQISPQEPVQKISRRYRPNTLVLETTIETTDGCIKLIDFMPMGRGSSQVMRIVVGERGNVPMQLQLIVRFDYGCSIPWVTPLDDNAGMQAVAGPNLVVIRSPAALSLQDGAINAKFSVAAGQCFTFALTYEQSHLPLPPALDVKTALEQTEAEWQRWSATFVLKTPWHEQILRSLITLRALIYMPTGGVVAAPTTSLPELLGGVRNWDYRYCWVRDATLTLVTLMNAGFYEEAQAWRRWLLRAVAGSPEQLQIMYGIAGERRLDEWEIPWLSGYENAAPVRIGNAASNQLQLDVYGELMDALHQARKGKLPLDAASWEQQVALIKHLETVWTAPDEGIWEVRGGPQHFTFSKIMAWVALDRAVKSIEQFGLEGPREHWIQIRDQIHAEVCARGFDSKRNCFVQSYGSAVLDASLLQIALVGFLPPEDPRVIGTIAAIERELMVDGLVMRYRTEQVADGLPPGENLFIACSFWLVDNYVLQKRYDEANALFERLLGLCNDVGLLSEEYDSSNNRLVGNFPQAFSHTALIHTALNLTANGQPICPRK
ncbi:MAG TPA: glycoside hydrolase family 15 protein [Spongiibacteraceae bacterium]